MSVQAGRHRQAYVETGSAPPLPPSGGRTCEPTCGVDPETATEERREALLRLLQHESEPVVVLTHLLRWCQDDHDVLRRVLGEPGSQQVVQSVTAAVTAARDGRAGSRLSEATRAAMARALREAAPGASVVVARALALVVDAGYHDTFHAWFAARSPYRPGARDPVPLDAPDVRAFTTMVPTSPPWRLANRLDQTRHLRLAGESAAQYRLVFDYSAAEALSGLLDADTVIATCHPNRSLAEFDRGERGGGRTFPVAPHDEARQREVLDRLIALACRNGATVVVLPELSVTADLAHHLETWTRRADGPRLLLAGSYHHRGNDGGRRTNTALAWVRGHDRPLTWDKHSPGAGVITEDIQTTGWPEINIFVSSDGLHVSTAVCRDLLNPSAVYALTQAGANLVLVPAMSDSLTAFGGSVANLVGARQAVVAVADNPAEWSTTRDGAVVRPPRALFGHPGLAQQTRAVRTTDSEPGVALMEVRSGRVTWKPLEPQATNRSRTRHLAPAVLPPAWATVVGTALGVGRPEAAARPTLPSAAVLVALTSVGREPAVVLTVRADDLPVFPGRTCFPGGMVEPSDGDPVSAALREASEEIGIDRRMVSVLGVLPPVAVGTLDVLVRPVLAWVPPQGCSFVPNLAEVQDVEAVPLFRLMEGDFGVPASATDGVALPGAVTALVLNALVGAAERAGLALARPRQVPGGQRRTPRFVGTADEEEVLWEPS